MTQEVTTMPAANEAKTKAQERADAVRSSVRNAGRVLTAKRGLLAKLTRNLMAEIKSEEVVYNDLCRKLVEANHAIKAATSEDSKEQPAIREAAYCHYLPAAVLNHCSDWYEAAKAEADAAVANRHAASDSGTGEGGSKVECVATD